MLIRNWLNEFCKRMRFSSGFGRLRTKRHQSPLSKTPRRRYQPPLMAETLEIRQLLSAITAMNDTCQINSPITSSAPTSIDVLANDSGGTGMLSITSVGTLPFGTVSIQHATSSNSHDTLLFVPMVGWSGTESCSYTVRDTAGNSATASLSLNVTVANNPPQIIGLSTHTGSTLGGSPLTINGSGFNAVTAVMIGSNVATNFIVNSPTSITVTTAPHSAGTVDVTVVTTLGSSSLSTNDQYTFQLPIGLPTITGVSPGTATVTGGTPITLTGTNFTNVTSILVGSVPALNVVVTSPTTITAIAPIQTAAGQVDVRVTNSVGTSSTSAGDQLLYTTPVLPPVVTGLSNTSGSTAGGNSITLVGTNFSNVTAVHVGNVLATTYAVNSTSSLTLVLPAAMAGMVDITVTNSTGTSGLSVADQYVFVSPAPVITGLNISSGSALGGTPVTITGANLTGTTAVWFGSIAATSFCLNSPTSLTAVSPAAAVGIVDLTVRSANGTSTTSAVDRFTYLTPPPTVTGLSLSSGLITGGSPVVITGTQLGTATKVLFGTVPAASFTLNNNGTLTAITPSASVGPVDVQVVSSTGTSAANSADQFVYLNPAPLVSSLSQSTGSTAGGDVITLTGSNFLGTTNLLFDSTPAPSFTVTSDGTIQATTPAHSAGFVDVTVVNSSGTSATSTATRYHFLTTTIGSVASPPSAPNVQGLPVIDGLETTGGSTLGGTTFLLYGTGFTTASQVMFGTVPASSFQRISDNELLVTTPPQSPGTLNITVQTPAGSSTPTAASQFTVTDPTAKPVVSSVTLAQNSNGAGSFLTVTGTNFSAATAVTVGGEPAVFLVNSPTTIVAVVPAGLSGTASVAISTPNGISAANSVSQVSLAATPIPNSSGNSSGTLPNPTGNPYVVSGNALPAVGSGSFGGTTGPATIPTAPVVLTNHPVATTTLTFPNGTNHTPVLAVTVVDSGASAYDTINTVTQSDGSILVTEQTGSTSFTFASSSNGLSGTAAASSLDVTRQMISTISVTLIAANNTGYTRFNACLTNQSWHSTTSNSVTRFSTDTHTTSVNSDQEQGLASLGGTDQKRVTLVTNSNLDDASNGTILATGIASGQFQHATNSSDNFRNDDANNTPADLKNSRMNGSDTANSTSLGTFTLNPDGTRIVADTYTGSSSGNDNYTGSETRTSTTVTPSATGSTTLYDRMVVNDSGFDEYQFSGFGTLAVAVDGTVSSVDNHTDNDDGNEERIVADAGWIQSDYTLPDGTVLSAHDDFSDQNDDQSRYDDGDQLAANTTTGGTDTPTSNFRETDPFQTNDQSTIRLTSVNAYGTPTISIITNKLTDQGQLSDRSQYRDQETLGAGEVDLEEDISFDNHSEEEDTATSDLKIVITTRGQVGVGEFLDSIETLTWKDTTPSTDTYRDVGTDNVRDLGDTKIVSVYRVSIANDGGAGEAKASQGAENHKIFAITLPENARERAHVATRPTKALRLVVFFTSEGIVNLPQSVFLGSMLLRRWQ